MPDTNPIRVRVRVNAVSPVRDENQNQTGEIVILGNAHVQQLADAGKLVVGNEYFADLVAVDSPAQPS